MTGLYRLYSAQGVLLYVGIADNIPTRLKQHSKDKPWWPEVASTAFQQFPSRSEAEAAEKRAIKTERPVHNVMHNGQSKKPAATFTERNINWACELCHEPIDLTAGKEPGYLQVTSAEAHRHRAETVAWNERWPDGEHEPGGSTWKPLNLEAVFDKPKRMHWEVICRPCDQARNQQREADGLTPDGGHYWVDLARVRTPGNFLEWTAHVMEKGWVAKDTDWLDLTAKVAAMLGSKGC